MEQTQLQPTETTAPDIVSDHYDTYKEVQLDILQTETRKTRNAIFIVAAILFGSDLLALLMANAASGSNLLYILVVPMLFVAIGFFALKQPLVAILAAILLYISLWAFTVYTYGGAQILSGLIVKAIAVTLLLIGLNNAREAEKARKNLKSA
jgi:hypothetical protein